MRGKKSDELMEMEAGPHEDQFGTSEDTQDSSQGNSKHPFGRNSRI